MFSISNLRNKKCTLRVENSTLYINDDAVKDKNIWILPCSLSSEFVSVIVQLEEKYLKKTTLFLEHSWLKNYKKIKEDEDKVDSANKFVNTLFENKEISMIDDENEIEGRFDSVFDMSSVYKCGTWLISPSVRILVDLSNLENVVFERMASYQKNFDITFCFSDNTTQQLLTVERKTYYNVCKTIFTDIMEGGPDPLNWPIILREKKRQKLSWKETLKMFLQTDESDLDDVGSEWDGNSESEEDDDEEELDNLVDEDDVSSFAETESDEEEESEEEESDEEDVFERKRSISETSTTNTKRQKVHDD
tara:strand:- start:2146 stop:3063 length:918 start_codon:yes stop_codon:yes gene_type:complete